jgi:PAS domain S-box-containing protein
LSDTEEPGHLELLRQQTILARFGELALQSDDLDEILTEACHLVGQALGTDLAKVMELQEDGETLLVRAGVGWKPGVVGEVTIKATHDSSEGYALRTGEPMISPDIARETRFTYSPFLTDNGVKAVANVIIIGGKERPPFGILQIDSREPRQFTDGETAFLRSYANLLAGAVDRLRVIGETRNATARLRLALEAGELGSWDSDMASENAIRTPRYFEIFGYTAPQPAWSYDIFLSHILPEDRKHVHRVHSQAADTGTELHFECRIRRAGDGEVRWIEVHGRPDGQRGNAPPTRMLGIVADITQRKLAEQRLRRSNEALEASVAKRTAELTAANARLEAEAEDRERVEEALRQSQKMEAVGQLTGGLAHDFNNLLTGISGSLEMMRARIAQGRTGDLGRYIETATVSANRAAALTHRLLAFSRRQTLDPKPTDVNRLVGNLEELFGRTVGPEIEIETSFAADPWPTLCDPNQLESALLNLIINARDAMPGGGQLLIETTNTALLDRRGAPKDWPPRNVPPGEYVCLSVADTGTGMSAEVIERAFDPFFTTKPIGQGTGLGLSMIYGFVQQSGGHVRLRSEEGQGTTVAIYLPRYLGAVDREQEAIAVADVSAATASAVVLVVEDEPAVRMIVVDVLSDLGYDVLEAGDGRSGLQILESGTRIDLLLTDVGLPGGMNGRQLADVARQQRPDLKVLFVTGYAESVAGSGGRMEHGMQVLTKPFAVAALAARVQGIINPSFLNSGAKAPR